MIMWLRRQDLTVNKCCSLNVWVKHTNSYRKKEKKKTFFHLKLLKLDRVFVMGQELLGLQLMLEWGCQIVQLGPHNKRKGNFGLRGRKKFIFLKDLRWGKNFWCERPTRAAGLLHPRGTWWTNNHGAPDAKSHKCKQSWDETCRHQKHAGCKYTAPHLCCQRRRCWELKIWNHSCLFAQNLQIKLRKKNRYY